MKESRKILLNKILSSYVVLLLILGAFVGILFIPTTQVVEADSQDWWDTNWLYRKLITIDSSFVDNTLTNFTILINIDSDSDLSNYCQEDGDDIIFVSYYDNETKLPHETEYFDKDTGQLIAWTKHDLYATENTKLWLYYKNDNAVNSEDKVSLWSDYVFVSHMTDYNATTVEDATGSPWHNGTKSGSSLPVETDGKIYKSQDFEADTNNKITAPDDNELSFGNGSNDNAFSFSVWLKPESLATAGQGDTNTLFGKRDSGGNDEYTCYMYTGTDINYKGFNFQLYDSAISIRTRAFADASQYYTVDDWHFITGTYSGNEHPSGMSIYHNTTNITTATYDSGSYVAMENKASSLYLGSWYYNDYSRMDGLVDEFRLIGKEWNISEIKVNYHSQNNSNGFITFDTAELRPPVSNEFPSDYSIEQRVSPILSINLNDPDGDIMNVTWQTNVTGGWGTIGTNNSVSNGTYRQTNASLNKYSTKYWWRVLTNDGNQWNNYTFSFTTEDINTTVNLISPYNITTPTLTINVTGSSDLDNVTLYYKYSSDNVSFNPNNHGLSLENSLDLISGVDPNVYLNYPNSAVVRDNGSNILMYIATYTIGMFQILDVTNPWNYTILDDIVAGSAHDVKLMEYDDYGLVAFVIGFYSDAIWSFNVTNPNNIVQMDILSGAGAPNYLDTGMYLGLDEDREILYATSLDDDAILSIDISDPNNLNILDVKNGLSAGISDPWTIIVDGEYDFIYIVCNGAGYKGIVTYNVSNASNITFVKNLSGNFVYLNYKDGNYYYAPDSIDKKLYIWNITDRLNWVNVSQTYLNVRGPVWIDWHYAYMLRNDQRGIIVADVYNKTNVTQLLNVSGDVSDPYNLRGSHWIQVHYNPYREKNVLYILNYVTSGLGIYNITYNETSGGWNIWNNISNPDTTSPWQFNFSFPNGTGYYEFASVGNWSGIPNETLPPEFGDTICYYYEIPQPPDQPTNEIPANNSDYIVPETYMNVTVTDPDADNMTVEFRWQNGSLITTAYNVTNGSVASIYLPTYQLIQHDTNYSWYVVVDDGITNTTSPVWNFNTSKAWDLNGDQTVNYLDASILIGDYGKSGTPGWIPSDINNDGTVNYLDASLFVGHYGESY
jgi:hypothetical protein